MYKYDGIAEGLTPLDMPSAEDCQLKLGCCWEDDLEVMQSWFVKTKCEICGQHKIIITVINEN